MSASHLDPVFLEELAKQLLAASHKVQTPLNGITGALELLDQTPITDEQKRYLDLIRTCLDELEKTPELLSHLAKTVEAGDKEKSPLPELGHLPVLNEEQLDVLREEGLLEALIGVYRETAEKAISDIETAFEKNDARAVSAGAHLLKGSSSNFGAERLVLLCQTLEISAHEEDLSYNKRLIEAIKKEYGCVSRELTFN